MNKLQTCLLFIIALPVIVLIGIPLFLLVFGVFFGFISSLISGIREVLLPLGCIFAFLTLFGVTSYIITSRRHKKMEQEMAIAQKEREQEMAIAIEKDKARFEALSTPEEYIAYYEEKLQEQREEVQERRKEVQRLKDIGLYEGPVGQDYSIRQLFENIADTKRTIKTYKDMLI